MKNVVKMVKRFLQGLHVVLTEEIVGGLKNKPLRDSKGRFVSRNKKHKKVR